MEHSDRGRHVTDLVSVWICNDPVNVEYAREMAVEGVPSLRGYLRALLINAVQYEGAERPLAWHVTQELAPNDYGRIDWPRVADDLLEGDE